MARRFTLAEARGLLPHAARLMGQAQALKTEYQEARRILRENSNRISMMGGLVVDRARSVDAKAGSERCAGGLKRLVEQIRELGCEVKDLDRGLIDFPTRFRGRDVFLCWKSGEPDIAHWHGAEEGFAGRKPVDQDFIDHHEGDPPQ